MSELVFIQEQLKKKVFPYIVKINGVWKEKRAYSASGVLFCGNGRSYVLTAAHVISDMDDVDALTLKTDDGRLNLTLDIVEEEGALSKGECRLYKYKKYQKRKKLINDVGAIEFSIKEGIECKECPRLVNPDKLHLNNEPFHISGYPVENNGMETMRPLEDPKLYTADNQDGSFCYSYDLKTQNGDKDQIMAGYSGSGVFAEYENDIVLVGITFGGLEYDDDKKTLIERAVTAATIRDFLIDEELLMEKEELLPDIEDALRFQNEDPNHGKVLNLCYAKWHSEKMRESQDETEALRKIRDFIAHSEKQIQETIFCDQESFPCQKFWNHKLFWALMVYAFQGQLPESMEKVYLQLSEEENVRAEFLCSESRLFDLIPKMYRKCVLTDDREDTIFFWGGYQSENVMTSYKGKEDVANIIGNIVNSLTNEEMGRLMDKQASGLGGFDICSGELQPNFAYISLKEFYPIVINSLEPERFRDQFRQRLATLMNIGVSREEKKS